MTQETEKTTAINYGNLDEAKSPSERNAGFSGMDTVRSETDETTQTTGDQPEVDPTKNPELKEENKLPPANELQKEEENPEQRRIAGEAPYITAGRPDAFTKEVEGGVVDEEGKSKSETPSQPKSTGIPKV